MVPFLLPLLGSLAGTMLPATLGTGIAASLGLGGTAAGGLIAAAAPKAIGAGIGTLLGGGDLGDAALNAVGFGAAGAGAAALGGAAAPAAATAAGTTGAAAAPAAAAATPGGFTPQQLVKGLSSIVESAGQNEAAARVDAPAAPDLQRKSPSRPVQANSMLAPPNPIVKTATASNIIPFVGGTSAMPASVGIGSLPFNGQPLASSNMMAGLTDSQRNMADQFLVGRGMTGFA